ncbi:MAG: hypothetical protein WCA77_00135 [Thermoplasmata archaeon]
MVMESPRPWSIFGAGHPPASAEGLIPTARVPTGVPDFDPMSGGIPAGSVVLLLGEAGAGHQEFALTSAVHLMLHYDDPDVHDFYLGAAHGPFVYPSSVAYVSLTRSREQVLREVQAAFDPLYRQVLERHIRFHDLSAEYFADSVVPAEWSALPNSLLTPSSSPPLSTTGTLQGLAEAVEADGESNLVVVDSLTDLIVRRGIGKEELLAFVKGLRRRAKSWNGLVYLLLSRGVTDTATEQALIDSVDGVLSFLWVSSLATSSRERAMVIEKFMSILARVPHERQGRFLIRVNVLSGLVTTQYERI